MKSIFSTQNLQTFFFRKYCRLPRGRPPGPPGPPPGPPSRRPPPGPPSRRGAPPPLGAGACFCSSAIPATLSLFTPTVIGEHSFHGLTKISNRQPSTALARGGGLLRSRCWRRCRRRGGAARTPCGALLALQRKLLLALQIFVEPDGLVLDDRVLHAEAAFQFGNQFAVRGANLL